MLIFPNRISVYVPTTVDVSTVVDTSEYRESCLRLLSLLFGGATQTNAIGAWLSDSGEIVTENVTIVYSNTDSDIVNPDSDDRVQVFKFAEYLKLALNQESVAVEINNTLYLT